MFDMLIREAAAKFGLGDKTAWILSALLNAMFHRQTDGLAGFLDLFKRTDSARIASSWLGGNSLPQAINPVQLENVIGGNLVKEIAAKTGLPSAPIGSALAFMLPKIVRALTPDGAIPGAIPPAISQYLGVATVEVVAAPAPAPAYHTPVPARRAAESKGFQWWWLLIPLILFLGWCAMRKPAQAPAPAVEPAKPVAEAPASMPVATAPTNSKLIFNNDGGKIYYNGSVADADAKSSVSAAITAAFGGSASGDIRVDSTAKGANWIGMLANFLPELKSISGSKLTLDGENITLDGSLAQGEIDSLMGKLKSIFGDRFNVTSVAQVLASSATATADNGNGDNLVSALNLAVIHYASGSAKISADNMAILKKAAATLNGAPAETKVEIGGHTDNAGNPASNIKLSKERANLVMETLVKLGVNAAMLTAKGYGDAKPLRSNDSPEGKAQNRRMEFNLGQ